LNNSLVTHALLDVWEVVVSNHSVDKSTDESLDVINGNLEILDGFLLNWSKSVNKELSHILSSLEVLRVVVVVLEGRNIILNSSEVMENILEDLLSGGLDVLELGKVSLDGVDVVLDIFAVIEGNWELSSDLDSFLDTSNDRLNGSLFEIGDGSINVVDEGLVVLHALLEFWEVVLSDETVHKSSNKLNGAVEVNGRGGSGKSSKGKGRFHFCDV